MFSIATKRERKVLKEKKRRDVANKLPIQKTMLTRKLKVNRSV